MENWYAVVSKPGMEPKAHADLARYHVESFYPRNRVRVIRNRRGAKITKWIERPYFPRYLFVRTDRADRISWSRYVAEVVSNTVEELVNGDPVDVRRPTTIPDQIMTVLMAGANADGLMGGQDEVKRARFAAAQKVRINDGSVFQDVIAKVLHDDGGDLVQVMVNILGGERVFERCPTELEAA